MFTYLDKHKRLAQVVLSLITVTFVFFGTYSYFQRTTGGAPEVASVNGSKVTQQDFDELLHEQQQRMQQSLGQNYDPAMFDNPEVRFAMVDQLVNQKLLEREAQSDRLRISDAQLTQFIAALPPFQVDGKFSPERYRMVLSGQSMSPEMFEQKLRNDLTLAPLQEPITAGNIVAQSSAQRYLSLLEQKREVAFASVDPEPFAAKVRIDDAAIKDFYDKNQAALQTPEQAKIEYIVLSPDVLSSKVSVTPEEVKAQYDQNIRQYGAPEERSAAHILITVKPEDSDAVKAAAKKKADELATKVRANPADFAKLAKENSQDPGSAAQGGDLGSFTHDAMVKPFADAVFAAKTGDIVGPVLSDFGYHVIKVGEITPARAKPFDSVKAQIETEMKRSKAQQTFANDAEKFQNLVYEQADSLQGVGKALDIKVTQTPLLTRAQVQQIAQNNPKFVAALFAPESIAGKRNTDAIEIGTNALMAGRIIDYKAAAPRPLDEVKDEIRRQLTRRDAAALAQKAGAERLAALQAGNAGDRDQPVLNFSKPVELTRAQTGPGMPPDALVKVFSADPQKLPAYVGSTNERGGYSIYRVSKVLEPAKLDDARLKLASSRMGDQVGRELLTAYLAGLRSRADVKINPTALEKKAAQP